MRYHQPGDARLLDLARQDELFGLQILFVGDETINRRIA